LFKIAVSAEQSANCIWLHVYYSRTLVQLRLPAARTQTKISYKLFSAMAIECSIFEYTILTN